MTPRELKVFLSLLDLTNGEACALIGCGTDELARTVNGARRNPVIRKQLVTVIRRRITEKALFGPEHELLSLSASTITPPRGRAGRQNGRNGRSNARPSSP